MQCMVLNKSLKHHKELIIYSGTTFILFYEDMDCLN